MPGTKRSTLASPKSQRKSRGHARMIRALIFDFDGLILDTETSLIDAYGDVHLQTASNISITQNATAPIANAHPR